MVLSLTCIQNLKYVWPGSLIVSKACKDQHIVGSGYIHRRPCRPTRGQLLSCLSRFCKALLSKSSIVKGSSIK